MNLNIVWVLMKIANFVFCDLKGHAEGKSVHQATQVKKYGYYSIELCQLFD